jgi:Cytochrome oxidase complex assembly protein 1
MEQPSEQEPPRSSWWSRNWKWALPVGCLLPIVLCGGGLTAFFFLVYGAVTGSIKASDAYAQGMAQARSNPEVVAALGEPIDSGFWISGSINVNGSSGDVDVSIPISGPKGSGTLYVVGTRSAGRWQYSTMAVEIPGRASRIDIRPRAP